MSDKSSIPEAMSDKDEEGPVRRILTGIPAQLFLLVCLAWATFHLLIASEAISMSPHQLRAIHLACGMILCFMLIPASKKISPRGRLSAVDWLLIVATAVTLGYTYFRYPTLVRMGGRFDPIDIWMGVVGMALLFEAARRAVSPGLVVLAAIALAYAYFGQSLPDSMAHAGYGVRALMRHLWLTGEGVFGFVLGVSAEIIIVFVLFGALLEGVGVADFFNQLANSIAGRTRGGPAKIAVISSALMGMVSGETSANVATTGVFTIPLMKRVGYPAYFAGAVECSASAGGQILPPIMGATAFVMADTLGIPYATIAIAAFFPAVLYFVGVFCTVHFRAVRLGLKGMDKDEVPPFLQTLRKVYLMLPLAGIVVLLMRDYTPTFSAFWGGIITAVIMSSMSRATRLNWNKLVNIAIRACRTAMALSIACALVGTIVGTASLTGVTMTIAEGIFSLTGGALVPSLMITMLVTIILGMGLPTTAAYVLAAISAVPVLIRLGIPELPAHMFVFYYGAMSALTPPVCTGAYTAAGIAGANPNATGFAAVRLALAGFVVPFIFIFNQELLMREGVRWADFFMPFFFAAVGLWVIPAAIEGALIRKLTWLRRIILGIAGVLLIVPENITSYVGLIICVVFALYEYLMNKRSFSTVNLKENP
ncbi:C4-dicarboxylate ABC transporter [Betaproteobacteria bacterium]|nr:C4-dicarboxylate ABC transporter [Betaproteobacteria bacterium]